MACAGLSARLILFRGNELMVSCYMSYAGHWDAFLVSIYSVPNEKYEGGSGRVKRDEATRSGKLWKEAEDRSFGERPFLEGEGEEVGLI